MGTSGNRPGLKTFSINTTIRNPNRNEDFLRELKDYDGFVFTPDVLNSYILKLISKGIYKVTISSQTIKNKLEEGQELTVEESKELLRNNPQACGISGRVMTQLRALKDQNFLIFETIKRGQNKISLTKFAHLLLSGQENPTDVYAKTMIGLHANNPARKAIFNRSRPFLNTIFAINEVNKLWHDLGNSDTGVALHEFGAFILGMIDCDYKKAAEEIIKYRKQFRFTIKREYIENYCYQKLKLIPGKFENITREYPDEVYRKFAMTGLLTKRNSSIHTMIDFSNYNIGKIKNLLIFYKKYRFNDFLNVADYYKYLENDISLPWEINKEARIEIAKNKAKQLGISITNFTNIVEIEQKLDDKFYFNVLAKAIENTNFSVIKDELLILGNSTQKKSKFEDIAEPLRLEYLLALALGKKFGLTGLISNIIYNEDGVPIHHAPSKRPDIIYKNKLSSFILEPTMSKNYSQQTNTETTSICEHVKNEEIKEKIVYRTMMIAPYVHSRVTQFFRFSAKEDNFKIIPLTINAFVQIIDTSNDILDFKNKFDEYLTQLTTTSYQIYTDTINSIKIQVSKSKI